MLRKGKFRSLRMALASAVQCGHELPNLYLLLYCAVRCVTSAAYHAPAKGTNRGERAINSVVFLPLLTHTGDVKCIKNADQRDSHS